MGNTLIWTSPRQQNPLRWRRLRRTLTLSWESWRPTTSCSFAYQIATGMVSSLLASVDLCGRRDFISVKPYN